MYVIDIPIRRVLIIRIRNYGKLKCGNCRLWGIEYLVFMEVANEGKAYYPSQLMPWWYDKDKQSPVEAILDEAARYDMKVFYEYWMGKRPG